MDTMPFENLDLLGREIHERVAQHGLPPEVSRVEVKFGYLQDGDPSVRVLLYVPEGLLPGDGRRWADLMLSVSQEARQVVPWRSASTGYVVDQRQH